MQPEDSVSQAAGSATSSTTRRLLLSARRAALQAEAGFVRRQQEMELKELQLRQEKDDLARQVQLASISAEEEVLARGEGSIHSDRGQSPSDHEVILNPKAPEYLPQSHTVPQVIDDTLRQLTEQGQQQQRQLLDAFRLPTVQIPNFDGNPLQYYSFIRLFEANVDRATVDSSSRLARLMQYCTGKARHVITGCAMMNPDEGYVRAKSLLKSRFGDEYVISEAWIDRVTAGTSLKPADRGALQNLADDLCNCHDTLQAMTCLSEVNNQKTLVKIIDRLPSYLQHRWRKEVVGIRRRTGSIPNFKHVMNFVKEAAEEANDPVYGRMIHSAEGATRQSQRRVVVNAVSVPADVPRRQQVRPPCPKCSQQHSFLTARPLKVPMCRVD